MANPWEKDWGDTAAPAATAEAPKMPWEKEYAPSTTEDVLKSGGVGLAKGVIAGAGGAGDVRGLASAATDYVGQKLGASPEAVQSFKDKAAKVAENLPGAAGTVGSILANAPSSGDIQKSVEGITGEFHKPQTTAGKYAETTGEFLGNPTSYLGPGSLAAKAVTAAGAGAGSEAAGQYAQGSKYEPLIRAIGGVAGGHAVTAVPRITPIIPAERQAMTALLEREGVPLTAGDRTGFTNLKAAESELSPGANDAQRRALEAAAFRRVGEHIGDRPILGQTGAVNTMMNRIGGQFDTLTARNQVNHDPQLAADIRGIHSTYNDVPGLYPEETVNSVNGSLQRVIHAMGRTGSLSGGDYQTLRSNLRAAAQGATDPQRAEALHGITNALDDAMERTIQRTNPADAGAWAQTRRDYRNSLVLQRWAGAQNMTPSTLAQSAKAVYGKNQYVRGHDDFSDLSEAARNVLKQYQDSGTARRLQIEGLLKGMGGVLGFGAGAAHGGAAGAAEGGVAGLLLGELAGPMIARPAARAALMNPMTQGALSNQLLPYRFETSPSTIALMNQIRGGSGAGMPPVADARKGKNDKIDAIRGHGGG